MKKLIFFLGIIALLALVIILGAGSAVAYPAWSVTGAVEQCMTCHEPGSFWPTATALFQGAHDGLVGECMTCHEFEGEPIHGQWGDTPEACARCHRTHTAAAPKLLVMGGNALCTFCHGYTPGLAQTNVLGGELRYNSGSLRGGGFDSVVMNTSNNTGNATDAWMWPVDGGSGTNNSTSTHSLDVEAVIWGSGNFTWASGNGTSAYKTTTTLECTSCHDPHAFHKTYRMLKKQPVDSAIGAHGSTQFAWVTDILAYAKWNPTSGILAYDTSDYTEVDYLAPNVYSDNGSLVMVGSNVKYSQQISKWCSSCHERYHAEKGGYVNGNPGGSPTGDAIFNYRHLTGDIMTSGNTTASCGYSCHEHRLLTCLSCHVAHGTTATMTPYAVIPWPGEGGQTYDGLPGTAVDPDLPALNWDSELSGRSSLLRLDNRGVCQNAYCHPKGTIAYLEDHEQGTDYDW
jgi:predicted CXXCH cytochrome family protein